MGARDDAAGAGGLRSEECNELIAAAVEDECAAAGAAAVSLLRAGVSLLEAGRDAGAGVRLGRRRSARAAAV